MTATPRSPQPSKPGTKRLGNYYCPECGHRMAGHMIHAHTSECPLWKAKHGKPWPRFKSGSPRYAYGEGAVEGEDFVKCEVCFQHGWEFCFKKLVTHLSQVHGLTEADYLKKFPGAPVRLSSTNEKRRETTLAKYGTDNVSRDPSVKKKIKESLEAAYGTSNTNLVPEIQEKRRRSNLERYGVENPFASPEIQEKIRQSMLERYGAENPQQVSEVREKTLLTVRERYGADYYVQTDDFREKFQATCLERYGEDHHMKSEEGRAAQSRIFEERYGVDNPLKIRELWEKSYASSKANHGGVHHLAHPEVKAKARATWMEKYGVDNPSKADQVKERIKEVWTGKYGVPFPPQSLWSNRESSFPNKLESDFDKASPECVVYTGDGSYWLRPKGSKRARNPDFVVWSRDQLRLYREGANPNDLRTSAVVEIFGDYWHGPEKTGKSRQLHKVEVQRFYAECGVTCLVLWESEVRKHPQQTAERLQAFLKKWRKGEARSREDLGQTVFDLFES